MCERMKSGRRLWNLNRWFVTPIKAVMSTAPARPSRGCDNSSNPDIGVAGVIVSALLFVVYRLGSERASFGRGDHSGFAIGRYHNSTCDRNLSIFLDR